MSCSYGVLPAVLVLLAAGTSLAEPTEAQRLVESQCAGCHRLSGDPPGTFAERMSSSAPPLKWAGVKYQPQWLENWLVDPTQIRPAGYWPYQHVVATPEGDRIVVESLPQHPRLARDQATMVADYLMTLSFAMPPYPTDKGAAPLDGEMYFHKLLACGACHQSHLGKGGNSGPELYTASRRLREEWVSSFMHDPQAWESHTMPRIPLRSEQIRALTDYIMQPKKAESVSVPGAAPPGISELPRAVPKDQTHALYMVQCSACHGILGNGQGINSFYMEIKPRNHTSFEEMSKLTHDHVTTVIKYGGTAVGKSAFMPPWRNVLQDQDVPALVSYLRRLSGVEF